jgi:chemotaxis protein methyltransferase CheR
MALLEAGDLPRGFRVIASDVDTHALETARAGIYPIAKAASAGPERLRRFFQCGHGAMEGFARIRPEVKALVEFRHVNLNDGRWPVEGPLAAIFCRNALIYFARDDQLQVLRRFAPLLGRDGLLFAGHSENFHYLAEGLLRARGRTVYAPMERAA